MAASVSVLTGLQGVAQNLSSKKNSFRWDSVVRNFQYGVAAITVIALAIYDSASTMKCGTDTSSLPTFYYVSAFCQEADWFRIGRNGTRLPYERYVRNFKWIVLIPPMLTIMINILYSVMVDSFILQAISRASDILKETSTNHLNKIESSKSSFLTRTQTRQFSEKNLHFEKYMKGGVYEVVVDNAKTSTQDVEEDSSKVELLKLDTCDRKRQRIGFKKEKKMIHTGHKTSLYYHVYLAISVMINIATIALINPYFFQFPSAIACKYRSNSRTQDWSVCSVSSYRLSTAAVFITVVCHAICVVVSLFSLGYLHVHIPRQMFDAGIEISSYTGNEEQREKLEEYWNEYGDTLLKKLTATTRFVLALIFQNMDRSLCYKLIIALVDIEKDKLGIDVALPGLIEEIIDIEGVVCLNQEREEKIRIIREVILNPVGIEKARGRIRSRVLVKCIRKFLEDTKNERELLKAQLIYRYTGVELPKLSIEEKNQFSKQIQPAEESDIPREIDYYRKLSALYDLSKSPQFFLILKPTEIGNISETETGEQTAIDNGPGTTDDFLFNAKKVFDTSGYCWRSKDATEHNWIRRSWCKEHAIKLVAVQASHTNPMTTPICFSFSALVENDSGNAIWINVSETFHSYDWRKDEWRIFPIIYTDLNDGTQKMPVTKCIQMNMLQNGGADYFEIQKIKIYGNPM